MTPKEKAKQIISDFYILLFEEGGDCGEEILVSILARKCALIAVKEILEDREEIDGMRVINDPYWLEVKQEIEVYE
jgi:hypothetical protein